MESDSQEVCSLKISKKSTSKSNKSPGDTNILSLCKSRFTAASQLLKIFLLSYTTSAQTKNRGIGKKIKYAKFGSALIGAKYVCVKLVLMQRNE